MPVFQTLRPILLSAPKNIANKLRDFRLNSMGGVAAVVAIVSPVLIGSMGLGGEAGYWYLTQRKVQNAADVMAHATAKRMSEGDDEAALQALATYLGERAEVNLDSGSITVNRPPTSGEFIEDANAVEIIVQETIPRMFSAIYSQDPISITARAVATAVGGGDGCVLALSSTASPAIEIFGTAAVTLINCEMISNGPGNSVEANFGANTLIAGCVRAAGDVSLGLLTVLDCPAPVENAALVGDPLAALPEPAATGACNDASVGKNNLLTIVTPTEAHSSGMLSKRYCNGIVVKGNTVFNPGLYIIEGGNFEIGANAAISGTGAVFYLADGVAIDWFANAAIVLTAPSSGTYNGILIFGDRDSTSVAHSINGTPATSLNGTIYTPASHIEMNGSTSTSFLGCTQVIADTLEIGGTAALTMHCLFPTGQVLSVAGSANVVE